MGGSEQLKIMLVDDHELMRHGLRQSLEKDREFMVVAETDNGRSAIDLAAKICPDIVIMDVSMPGLNGIEATRRILAANDRIKVIALSIHRERLYVMGMLNVGAVGFLLKTCTYKELSNAVRTVASGKVYLSSEVAGIVVENALNPSRSMDIDRSENLTPRDREVLQLIAEGEKSGGIAEKLNISKRTVDVHRRNLMTKLDLHSVAEMTKFAIRHGITPL
ncbi:MAG: response regulator transcription factor [Pseudomonadota bacterium]